MCDIDLKDTSAYSRAEQSQLEKFKKTRKHIYHMGLITNEYIRSEMEKFVRTRCDQLALLTVAKDISRYERVAEFLNQYCKDDKSICDKKKDELERKFQVFLLKNGLSLSQKRARKDRKNDKVKKSDLLWYLLAFYKYIESSKEVSIPEKDKDIWDVRNLAVVPENNPIRPLYKVDFTGIRQDGIRNATKEVLYDHCSYKSCQTVRNEVWAMGKLSVFLERNYGNICRLEELTRDMIEEFLIYLKTDTGLSISSYNYVISYVGGVLRDWGLQTDNIELGLLFVKGDSKTKKAQLPEFYTDGELKRFNEALTRLQPQIMRCLILHQILGTRIAEVLMLRADCLSVKKGQAYVEIYQHKVNQHYKKPVNQTVVALIKSALAETRRIHPESEYVFLQDNGTNYTYGMIVYQINAMIMDTGLKDDQGSLFVFKTHKFRHTYGIKHAESNADDKQVADLLGHHGIRSVHNYRMVRNEKLAEATRGIRNELNNVIRESRRESNGEV